MSLKQAQNQTYTTPFLSRALGSSTVARAPTGAFSYPRKSEWRQGPVVQSLRSTTRLQDPRPYLEGSLLTRSSHPTKPVALDRVFSFSTFEPGSSRFFQVAPWVVNNAEFQACFRGLKGTGSC